MPLSSATAGSSASLSSESSEFADKRLQALFAMGRALGSSLSRDEILQLVVHRISEVLDAERATIFLLDKERDELIARVAQGADLVDIRLPVGTGIAGHVARSARTVRVDDAYSDPRFHAAIDRATGFRTRSVLAAPLRRGDGSLLGVAQVLNKRGGSFTAEDESALSSLANVIAVAVENSRLRRTVATKDAALESARQELQQRVAEVDLLLDIEREISSSDDRKQMVGAILTRAMATVGATGGAVLLHGEPMHELHVKQRSKRTVVKAIRPDDWQNSIATDLASGKRATVEGVAAKTESLAALGGQEPRAALLVPLVTQGVGTRQRGVLELSNDKDRRFSPSDVKIARLVSAQLARAVSLAGARAETERASRFAALGQMLGAIIHDIRSPMTVISGYSELMAREPLRDLRERYASEILSQFEQIESMTREVLAFIRGERRLLVRRVELERFWQELDGVLEAELVDRGMVLNIDQRYRGTVRVDDGKLKRLVTNLARNAAQAMEPGGRFDISVFREADTLVLEFSDTGPGLPADLSFRLFSALSTRGNSEGTGLGLAIVKGVVDAHGGTICCDTVAGVGTRFTVRLPGAVAA